VTGEQRPLVSLVKGPRRGLPPAEPPVVAPSMSAPPGAWTGTPRPLFGHRWPGPVGPATPTVLAAAAVAGAGGAVAAPTGPTGIGWPLAALVALAALGVVLRRAAGPDPAAGSVWGRPADRGWMLLAVALASVGAIRGAEWLASLCLLAAAAAVSLAVAGRSFRGLPSSLCALPAAALRAVPWLGRGLRAAEGRPVLRAVAAGLVGVALLAVFVPLLAAADAAFRNVVDGVLPTLDGESVAHRMVMFGLAAGALAGAGFLLLAPPAPPAVTVRPTRLRLLDWALPAGLLVALFTLFVGVQFVVLFGSDDYVLRTTGLTYAEYARRGFWQLLAVTVLTLGVLAAASRWAPAGTAVERAWKRGLLGTLANLTLIIVASAISRMWLYQQAYGFTVLRLVVLTCELWLGVGFVIALVSAVRLRPVGLTRPMVAAGMLALLGLAALDPERFVAQHNVTRWVETGRIDVGYLSTLSADAVPPLLQLPEPARSCALAPIARTLEPDGDWRDANFGRAAARAQLTGLVLDCPDVRWPS
jgi:Domain of unknown function (DUF4173)